MPETCPKCDHILSDPDDPECEACGVIFTKIKPAVTACPDCRGKVSLRAESCPHCGAPLKKASPPPAEPAAVKTPTPSAAELVFYSTLKVAAAFFVFFGIIFILMAASDNSVDSGMIVFMAALTAGGVGVYRFAAGKAALQKPHQLCPQCGSTGVPKLQVPGSIWLEIFLWFLLLVPGFIYSIWRLTSKQFVCPHCGNPGMIPPDSPMGRKIKGESG